ncbi:glycine-rich domain-containing protein [Aquiflexum sp.]|uniref:glycine-rich domain-containing protein n=1 Tax=Aquiflexum sp. TaxID=1872584 RepID=UPI0035941935
MSLILSQSWDFYLFKLKKISKVFLLVVFFTGGVHMSFSQTVTRTFDSSGTFIVPDKITSINVSVWGAGGGGGYYASGNSRGAGGGGGGGFSQSINFTVSPGSPIIYVVGTGGFGASTTTASNGGQSVFGSLVANGGTGASGRFGGAGGNASGGLTNNRSGGNGGTQADSNNRGGAGGGAAGNTAGNGVIGVGTGNNNGGAGGVGINGAGSGGNGGNNGNNGNDGALPGGGGGGEGGNGVQGGNGGNGRIIVSWSCSATLASGLGSNNQSVCINAPIANITYELVGAYGATFSGLPDGVAATYSNGDIIISGAPSQAGTFEYTITPIGACESNVLTGTISVSPNRTAGTITANTFCEGSPLPPGAIQPITGVTIIGTAVGLPAGVSADLIGNDIVFSGTPTESGTFDYTIPLIDGCGTENATGTIVINSIVAIIDPSLDGQISCLGSTFDPIYISPQLGFTYQWFENTFSKNFGGIPVVGANSHEFIPPTNSLGTFYYYVEVTGLCGDPLTVASPVSGAFEVYPGNAAEPGSISPTVCVNDAIPDITHLTFEATGIGVPVNLPDGVDAIWSANEIIISGTPTQSGVFDYSIPLVGGCGEASATGTIRVNAYPNIPNQVTPAQEVCLNSGFSSIGVSRLTGLSYRWYSNTIASNSGGTLIAGANSNIFTPPSNVEGTMYYYVEVFSNFCGIGDLVYSAVSGPQTVNPLPVVTFETQPSGNFCVGQDITYTTQAGQSDYVWTLPGTPGIDYVIIIGGTSTDDLLTVRWLTPGSKSISINYANSNGCFAAVPRVSTPITVQINTFTPSNPLAPRVCVNQVLNPVSINTTLATGIGSPVGLPPGVTASFTGNTISISGTPTASGTYNYSIPLTGGCGSVNAVGTIVVSPVYELRATTSVSPSNSGGSATVTIRGDVANLPNGTYTVTYRMGLANPGGPYTATVNVVNGRGSFTTVPVFDADLTSLEILTIRRPIDTCAITLTENNITFFGICAAVYEADGFFYVPAGIFEITIKVWGGGGKGGNSTSAETGGGGGGGGYATITVPVNPGQTYRVKIGDGGTLTTPNGGPTLVTRSATDDLLAAIVYANGGNAGSIGGFGTGGTGNSGAGVNGLPNGSSNGGNGGQGGGAGGAGGNGAISNNSNGANGNAPGGGGGGARGNNRTGGNGGPGLVIISYSCPPISPDNCFVVRDDGARTGFTIIEFTCATNEWVAPTGLLDFTVVAVGSGGGGGMGTSAGGGGAGGLVTTVVSSPNPNGIEDGTIFNINVGQGGLGATSTNNRGGNGEPSSFTGMMGGTSVNIIAPGGGGGGSYNSGNIANGISNGASGGGGAYYLPTNYIGSGGAGTTGMGYAGGNGDLGTGSSPAIAGGGGGGAGGLGETGDARGSGQSKGGNGGQGLTFNQFGLPFGYGGGGGGAGDGGNSGQMNPGTGGSAPGFGVIGGTGNVTGLGLPGQEKTGSGGGAGRTGGGAGGSGVVYIIYENFRILPVEYIFIKAQYVEDERMSLLTWATSKEWENSHFEVQRSFQNVNNWTTIGSVEGMGYADEPVYYKFEDKELPLTGGNLYYRLNQVDFSGKSEHSRVLSVRLPALQFTKGLWRAYPNPNYGETLKVSLLDADEYDGKNLSFRIIQSTSSSQLISVATEGEMNEILGQMISGIAKGVFILEIQWGQKVEHIKVLKK